MTKTALEDWPWLRELYLIKTRQSRNQPAVVDPPQPRLWANSRRLDRLWRHFHGRCFHCGELTILSVERKDDPRMATRDHLIPRSRGGKGIQNIVLSCHECNGRKGNQMPDPTKVPLPAGRIA